MATHSSILAWRIPWTEEPGGLQSKGLQRVRHDWATLHAHKERRTVTGGRTRKAKPLKSHLPPSHPFMPGHNSPGNPVWAERDQEMCSGSPEPFFMLVTSPQNFQTQSATLVQWFSNFSPVRVTSRSLTQKLLGSGLQLPCHLRDITRTRESTLSGYAGAKTVRGGKLRNVVFKLQLLQNQQGCFVRKADSYTPRPEIQQIWGMRIHIFNCSPKCNVGQDLWTVFQETWFRS